MAVRFLPGLRGIETKSYAEQLPALIAPERKVITAGYSGGYSSITYAGTFNSGTEDRAAGWDLGTVVVNGYERVVWVYKSIEAISGHASRLPFVIGRNLGTDNEELLVDHPLYRVLNKRANPLETGRQFRKRLSAQVLLSKRGAFVEVTRSNAGTITRLDLLPPDRVRPIPSVYGEYLDHWEFTTRSGQIRELGPEKIRWIREPHPTDPYCGTTPLEAAGISIELDHLSRLYNVSFIRNDGRPGGIVGVDTDSLDGDEMDRIEARFGPGVSEAGKITVIGTGPGGLNYVDTTTRPRDMAYGDAARNAKMEILAAFGVPESLMGNTSGRTYDNAEQDLFNFWTEVMQPHLAMIAGAFDEDIDDDWDAFLDTAGVEPLELPRRRKREEARQEWNAGLRSANEYRPMAGLETIDSPYAEALWISPAKAPIPRRPEDAAALGLASPAPGAPGAPGPDGTTPPAGPGGPGEPLAPTEPPAGPEVTDAADQGTAAPTSAHAAVDAARGDTAAMPAPGDAAAAAAAAVGAPNSVTLPGAAAGAVEAARTETKSLDATLETKAVDHSPAEVAIEPNTDQVKHTEIAVSAALTALLARQQGVVTARLASPKTRKGTRFWTPESAADTRVGTDPIDPDRIVDEDKWVSEATDTLTPIITQAAADSGHDLLTQIAGAGLIAGTIGAAPGTSIPEQVTSAAAQSSTATVLTILTAAGEAVRGFARDVKRRIELASVTAGSVDAIADSVRSFYDDNAADFAANLGTSLAGATVNGAREAAAAALSPAPTMHSTVAITRTWVSQRDDRVRPSHQLLDDQTKPVGVPYQADGVTLRFPCDPLAPLSETAHCRCNLRYKATPNAQLLLATS